MMMMMMVPITLELLKASRLWKGLSAWRAAPRIERDKMSYRELVISAYTTLRKGPVMI